MESERDTEIISLLREHFTSVSAGDAKLVWDAVKGYSVEDATRAIIEHRKERGASAYRPDVRRIGSLAAGYCRDRQAASRGKVKVVEEIRRTNPIDYTDVGDLHVINTHFKRAWRGLSESGADPKGIAIMRGYMLNSARTALYEIGYDAKEADDMAHILVGLEPGEKIPRQGVWNIKQTAKLSWEALKDLAVAAHALPSPADPSSINAA